MVGRKVLALEIGVRLSVPQPFMRREIMDFTGRTKFIISVIGSIILIGGVIIGIEDRFENESDAAITKADVADLKVVSDKQIETLDKMQRKSESDELKSDVITLEVLRNQRMVLKEKLRENPTTPGLEDRIERIEDLIEKLENKIYQ
jgi:hypothetical protein